MKNFFIIVLFLMIGSALHAQQSTKTHLLIVAIHAGVNASHPEMIVTKEDGTQDITVAKKGTWMYDASTFDIRNGKMAANEDSLFQTLKPFIAAGWKLASTYILHEGTGGADDYLARYFFTKED